MESQVKTKGDEMELERLLTIREAAPFLGMAVQTIYNKISQGEPLPQYVKVGKSVRFPESAIREWVEALKQQAAEARPARLPDPAPRRKREAMDDARRAWVESWKQAAERAAEEAAGLAPKRRGRPTKAELIARREAGLALARAQGLIPG